jgi:hypothetical protein
MLWATRACLNFAVNTLACSASSLVPAADNVVSFHHPSQRAFHEKAAECQGVDLTWLGNVNT